MAGSNVKIDNEYYLQLAKLCKEKGEELNGIIKSYLNIMRLASEKGLVGGASAENLKTYISFAGEMEGKLDVVGTMVAANVERFLTQVDEDDTLTF